MSELLKPGFAATVGWLAAGVTFYEQSTHRKPERIVLNKWVAWDIYEAVEDWLPMEERVKLRPLAARMLEEQTGSFMGIPVIINNERCRPDICDDAITYLEGEAGVLWLICDATPRVVMSTLVEYDRGEITSTDIYYPKL